MQSTELLERWHLDLAQVRDRMYEAERPRERERWHALRLVGQGWTHEQVARALDRDPYPIGVWLDAFHERDRRDCASMAVVAPPVLDVAEQAALKAAVAAPPSQAAIPAATWPWKAVRQFVAERFGKQLSPRS